jgi:hypothetical protein
MNRLWTSGAALVVAAALAGACRSAPPSRPTVSAARGRPSAQGGLLRPACENAQKLQFPQDWKAWRDRTVETWIYASGGRPLENLDMVASLPSPEVTHMLRRGLESCDATALRAIRVLKRTELLPELRALVATDDAEFGIDILAALEELDPGTDYSRPILALLGNPRTGSAARGRAVELAAHLALSRAREPLLAIVRRDWSFDVRVAAAQTLLTLGDIHPGSIYDHPELQESLKGDAEVETERETAEALKEGINIDYLIFPAPPTPTELARYANVAGLIEQLLVARGARDKCSSLARFGVNHLHFSRVNDRVLALIVDQAESSCEKEMAFVLFIQTDFPVKWYPTDIATVAPDSGGWELPIGQGKLDVLYTRGDDILRVGNLKLKRGTVNVALVVATPQGATLIYSSHEKLTFPRDANPLHVLLEASDDLSRHVDAGPN